MSANAQSHELTYDLIKRAVHGDQQAIEAYLLHYDAYINSLVAYDEVGPDGRIYRHIDEDMGLPVPEMTRRLEDTTKSLKLEKLLNRSLFALSGGEKQKIACASADAIHPDIFVLDEPSSNLDIATIEDLMQVIRHWQSEQKTILVAEHRLYYLVHLADRIFYMKHGAISKEFTRQQFQSLSPETLQ